MYLALLAWALTACDRDGQGGSPAAHTPAAAAARSERVTAGVPPAVASAEANRALRASNLPLTLVGTVVRQDPAKSMAAIRVGDQLVARNYRPGQQLMDDAVLAQVERNRVLIRRGDALEVLSLSAERSAAAPTTPAPTTSARPMPTPDRVVDLRRGDVDYALHRDAEPGRRLEAITPDRDGRRLLVVADVEPASVHELLGLRSRDVLLQVDGEWVDAQHNPLWDALRQRERVRVLIVRAGVPLTVEYLIR